MLVVNLYAGPGAGKTALAHAITGILKMRGLPMVVEYVGEYAKRLVFEGRRAAMSNQILVLGRQFQELGNLRGQADIVITDGPMLHGIVYGGKLDYTQEFYNLAVWCDRQFDTMNVFVDRHDSLPFEEVGRVEGKAESLHLDREIFEMLHRTGTPVAWRGKPTMQSAEEIADLALSQWMSRSNLTRQQPSWFDLDRPKAYRTAA